MSMEETLNAIRAIERAKAIKEYCNTHSSCKECSFYCGVCGLSRHPFDWDFKEVDYGKRGLT